MKEIKTILRKNYPITVLKMKVGELDKTKCSNRFLELNIDDSESVYVKCNDGCEIEYRGRKQEYRLYSINEKEVFKVPFLIPVSELDYEQKRKVDIAYQYLPIHLKESFYKRFLNVPTESELNDFLLFNDNTIIGGESIQYESSVKIRLNKTNE